MKILFLLGIFASIVTSQSSGNMTESGQINRLVFDSVATSPAFITRTQFFEAWSAAIPYLPKPENVTQLDVAHYPLFMNSAVMIGKINNVTQLAMYFAQVLYESNGMTVRNAMPCSRFGSHDSCSSYIDINVDNNGAYNNSCTGKIEDYHGRGFLFLENVDNYRSASQELFGNEILYKYPKVVNISPSISWSTSAWIWVKKVGSLVGSSDAFGLSTKFLRPGDCSSKVSSENAQKAFDIYQKVLSVFDPDRTANQAGCIPT